MTQQYTDFKAIASMRMGGCPECGRPPERHSPDNRFWIPRECDLTPKGVTDRIDAHLTAMSKPKES
jgi:hypothetical protein